MQIGAALRDRPGIVEGSCIMATPANLEQLQHAGLAVDADARPSFEAHSHGDDEGRAV